MFFEDLSGPKHDVFEQTYINTPFHELGLKHRRLRLHPNAQEHSAVPEHFYNRVYNVFRFMCVYKYAIHAFICMSLQGKQASKQASKQEHALS